MIPGARRRSGGRAQGSGAASGRAYVRPFQAAPSPLWCRTAESTVIRR